MATQRESGTQEVARRGPGGGVGGRQWVISQWVKSRVAAVCLLSLTFAVPVRADVVTAPFLCKVERGRITLKPGPESSYEIVGPRRQKSFLYCTGPGDSRCQVRMLHQFDLACGGNRVPWVVVAAAATRLGGREAWVDSGRLHIAVNPGLTPKTADCGETSWSLAAAFDASQADRSERACQPRAADRSSIRAVALPPGFAQLTEFGARLGAPARRPTASVVAAASPLMSLEPEAADPDEPLITAALPLPDAGLPSPAHAESGEDPPANSAVEVPRDAPEVIEIADARKALEGFSAWIVTVRQERAETAAALSPSARGPFADSEWLVLVALLSLTLVGVAWSIRTGLIAARGSLLMQRTQSSAVGLFTRTRATLVPADASGDSPYMIEQLRQTAEQLLHNADLVLEELRSAPPLRGVLRQELDLIGTRLFDSTRATGSEPTARQTRQRLQTGIRELHRIIKIAEGAAASFCMGAMRPALPNSRDEAFALLGVNDSVNDATLKKVVDALRVSWHPDHARDDQDRERREERIKQINVAWDLINGRRLTA